MRVVVCDDEALLREMVEGLVARLGHELTGVADNTVDGVHLVEAARPDVVILDLSLGVNTDFDVIASALSVGARPIVFSRNADDAILSRYEARPTVVPKPDLTTLEEVLARLDSVGPGGGVVERDRRERPVRAAQGPPSTGPADAQAFYEALNAIEADDALLSIEAPGDLSPLAHDLLLLLRAGDRLLASPQAVRVLLPGGGEPGITSLLARLEAAGTAPPGTTARAIVAGPGEVGAEAFERLKAAPQHAPG